MLSRPKGWKEISNKGVGNFYLINTAGRFTRHFHATSYFSIPLLGATHCILFQGENILCVLVIKIFLLHDDSIGTDCLERMTTSKVILLDRHG